VTEANLVQQGTIMAQLAGVTTTEVDRLRSIPLAPPLSDRATAASWVDELQAAADAEIRAVEASANRDVATFRVAVKAAGKHWGAAGLLGASLGLSACQQSALDGTS
jgi:hypothetical protein